MYNVLKQRQQWKRNMLPDLAENLRGLIMSQYAEADHAICGRGTWPSCTVQMLARNWAIVADQGPTARLRRTKREKCDSAAAYEMKEKRTKKHKKAVDLLRPNSFVATVGQRFTVIHGCNIRLQQKAAKKCKSFMVYFCSFAVLRSPMHPPTRLWSTK